MEISRRSILQDAGQRLRKLRKQLNNSPKEMAAQLGIKTGGYYKNENGETFPGMIQLYRLQRNFDISMDWFIFEKGPMCYKEKLPEKPPEKIEEKEKKPAGLEETMPEVRELLDYMARDPLLRYTVLISFYRYKEKKEKESEEGK